MTDEAIIKRRLMFDGEGTGDNRRLNLLLKLICKWGHTKVTAEENQTLYDKILNILCQCESVPKRSQMAKKQTKKELNKYKNVQTVMEKQISSTRQSINYVKEVFKQSKLEKQNKMMYDLLTNEILVHPARAQSLRIIKQYKNEVEALSKARRLTHKRFENLRKQFHVFITSSNQILKDIQQITDIPEVNLKELNLKKEKSSSIVANDSCENHN